MENEMKIGMIHGIIWGLPRLNSPKAGEMRGGRGELTRITPWKLV